MKENRSAFNAKEYDNKIEQTLPYRDEIHRQIIGLAGVAVSGKLKWLDVGCGTGKMAEMIQDQLQIEHFVFCDESEEMIGIVRNKDFSGFEKIDFIVKSAENLNYGESFDIVTAVQVNHYAKGEKRRQLMNNSFAALKKGGIYITVDNFAPDTEKGKAVFLERWKRFQINSGKSAEEAQQHLDRYGVSYFPVTISEQLKDMKTCGFQAVEIFWLSYMQAGLFGIK